MVEMEGNTWKIILVSRFKDLMLSNNLELTVVIILDGNKIREILSFTEKLLILYDS